MNKRINLLALAVLALFSLGSCDEIDELTKFDMDFDSSVTIDPPLGGFLPIGEILTVQTPEITTTNRTEFESNDTNKDLVESVKLKSLNVKVNLPDGEDLSFLESVVVSISADGLSDVEIASQRNIPDSATEIDMDILDVELREFIKKDKFVIKTKVVTDEVVDDRYKLDIKTVVKIDAKILGI